jgi:hypothetical protein
LAAAPKKESLDERVQVPVEHAVGVPDLDFRPQVFDQPVGMKNVGADLAAKINVELAHFELFRFRAPPCNFQLIELRAQNFHGHLAIAVLRALVLALRDGARRQVGDAHGRVGGIDVLTAATVAAPLACKPQRRRGRESAAGPALVGP